MSRIIITGHGNFASGISTSLELITGIDDSISTVDFKVDNSIDDLETNLLEMINKDNKDLIILCDLLGGSPFKISCLLKERFKERNIEVIGGTNLAMLLQAYLLKDAINLNELIVEIIKGGHDAINFFQMVKRDEVQYEDGI